MIEVSYPWDGAPRSWRDRAIAWSAQTLVHPSLKRKASWQAHRRGFRAAGALRSLARAAGAQTKKIGLGRLGALEITPPAPSRRLIWIHGGGFVLGSPETHLAMMSHLAVAANALVIAPRYPLAPEHPFPAAVEAIEEVIGTAMEWRPEIGPPSLGGDSAGGCLALVALARLLREGRRPAAVVLFSPATLMDPARPVPKAKDLLFPEILLHRIGAAYAAGADIADPRLSPVLADFPGAPPTLIQCVAGEYLEEDSDWIAERLSQFGARVTVEKARRLPHVWQFMAGSSPRADDAIARVGAYLDALT